MSFVNKSALVTGGTGAIGGAICEEFLKNGVTHLAALDLNSDEPKIVSEWRKKFPKASIKYFRVDVSSDEELRKCYSEFTKGIQSLDIVVNCAGILNEKVYRKVIEINLCGTIGSTLIALEYMRMDTGKGKGGLILNVASTAGLVPMSAVPSYCASKHGVVAFTRALAFERDYMGIKFFLICPSSTQSQLYEQCFMPDNYMKGSPGKQDALKVARPPQSPSAVAEQTIKILKEGRSGSVWLSEDYTLTEVTDIPVMEW